MIEFLKIRNVKQPERERGNAGIDVFIPDFSKDFQELLKNKNPGITITEENIVLQPSEAILIPSGLKTKFNENIALIATNKSGQATKKRLEVGATCVDSSYRGEIHIHVYNSGSLPVKLNFGEKVVQFVPYLIDTDDIEVSENVTEEEFYGKDLVTERGEGGFGSTSLESKSERKKKKKKLENSEEVFGEVPEEVAPDADGVEQISEEQKIESEPEDLA